MNDMRRTKELAVLLLSLLLLMGMVPVQVFATAADNVESSLSADNSLSTLSLSAGTLSPSFQYNVTDYTASVGADVASVEVTAKTSNEFATVESISGNTDLQPGQNTVSVVVKAQNGATATYKIVVTKAQGAQQDQPQNVEPSVEEPEAPQEGQDSQQGQGGIAINGHSFDLAATVPDDVIPQDFTKDTVTCQGQQVECLRFEKGTLTLVYLTTPSTEVKNTLAVYEEASGTFYPFRRVSQGEASYLIILNPPAETGLPQEYALSDQSIGGFENVPAFVRAGSAPKAGEGIGGIQGAEGVESESTLAEGGFALIYAASSFGNIGWYSYDKAEATFQRYLPTGDSVKNPEGTDQSKEEPSVEMLGLQNAYKDLEEKYNQKKDSSRKITAVMIFVIAVLVIVIINLIIRNRKASEEEAYDDEPQGSGVNEDVSFTLDAVDRHAVAYPTYCTSKNSHFTRAEKELANTLVATDYKDPPVINDVQTASGKEVFGTLSASMGSKQWLGNQEAFSGDYHIVEPEYIVRRLTPTECARLQGFPDWWCGGLGTEEPTEEDLVFWREVFETHRKIAGTSTKPKTDRQIIKWLKDPHSDSAEYKMWGNGVALPNVYFVLSGIVYYAQFPEFLL